MPYDVIFLCLFVLFIAGMLALDLGVFDRHSHEVKFKEALIWTIVWVSLALLFYLFIRYKGELIHGITSIADIQERIQKYRHPIRIDGLVFEDALRIYKYNLSLEYVTGYLIEYMLSVDNVFVMLLIFISFGVQKMYYKRVLFWGIIGAIVLRFFFIFISSALIQRFFWVLYVFGAFLIFTGVKMFLERNKSGSVKTSDHPVVKFASKYLPVYSNYFRGHFWFRNKKDRRRLYFTPLFLVLLVVEFTDVIFAVDSVPAIFAVSQDPFVVFFSNIFAILGLRSLFFVVAHIISMLRFLKHGLSILLTFIGLKMISHLIGIDITTEISLLIVTSILGLSIAASLIWPEKNKKQEQSVELMTGEKPTEV